MHDRVIVLVEDNESDEELTLRAFRKSSVANRIVVVRDGAEALDYFFARGLHANRQTTEVPQLVLLDLKLPKVDGLEVLARLKADPRTRSIPVVMLTSSQEQSDLLASYQNGVNSYIVKPVNFEAFVQAVAELGMYWMMLNEPPETAA